MDVLADPPESTDVTCSIQHTSVRGKCYTLANTSKGVTYAAYVPCKYFTEMTLTSYVSKYLGPESVPKGPEKIWALRLQTDQVQLFIWMSYMTLFGGRIARTSSTFGYKSR